MVIYTIYVKVDFFCKGTDKYLNIKNEFFINVECYVKVDLNVVEGYGRLVVGKLFHGQDIGDTCKAKRVC